VVIVAVPSFYSQPAPYSQPPQLCRLAGIRDVTIKLTATLPDALQTA
jgi:hypothetical protein